jgi:hypothetical protein
MPGLADSVVVIASHARTRHHGHELLRKGEHQCHFDATLTDLWRTSRFKEKGLSSLLPPKP